MVIALHEDTPIAQASVILCATMPKALQALQSRLQLTELQVTNGAGKSGLVSSLLVNAQIDSAASFAVGGLKSHPEDVSKANAELGRLFPGERFESLERASPNAAFALAAISKQMHSDIHSKF